MADTVNHGREANLISLDQSALLQSALIIGAAILFLAAMELRLLPAEANRVKVELGERSLKGLGQPLESGKELSMSPRLTVDG